MIDAQPAIKVEQLSKRYSGGMRSQGVLALSELSLEVKQGEIFGLLGPNGAGKTTLIKILLGSLRPTSGRARINDHSVTDYHARTKAGYLPENHRFPLYLTGAQLLRCYGGMAGLSKKDIRSREDALLDLVGMKRWRKTKIKKYSKGMMQRLGLAQALLTDPDLIFLDEPTDGVDPIGRHEIRTILLNLKNQNKTIFLNSHLLAEVEAVCDRVAVLDKGKLLKVGPAKNLIDTRSSYVIEVADMRTEMPARILNQFPQAIIKDNKITIAVNEPRSINEIIDYLRRDNVDLISVQPLRISLEDSFLELIRGGQPHE